jgi:integrase
VKFPKRIKHRGKVLATIYGKSKSYPGYRVVWSVAGRRLMKRFPRYGEAKRHADQLVKDLAGGSQVTALTPGQARDALAALERLQGFYQSTGRRVSLLAGISEYCEAAGKLGGYTVGEAVERFLATSAVVQRKAPAEAVAEFIEGRKHLAEAKDGKRSKLSPVYAYNVAMWLNEFAGTFPGHAVCDLTKEHLNIYIGRFKELSAKSRNDRRAAVKMFLGWCVQKDYLAPTHRLFEAVDFKTEGVDAADIDFYRPKELRDMLDAADAELVPVIALGGLAGLRREEILRLDWADVWRVKGMIEISARIAKGRKRRLVDICPALAAWLRPYRDATGPVWGKSPDALEEALTGLRDTLAIPARRNGLRHAFVTFHMAMHANENLTAAEAGNSPQMIHDHYRALATRPEAVKWFTVKPAKTATKIVALPVTTGGAA